MLMVPRNIVKKTIFNYEILLIGQERGLGKNALWCYLSPLFWDTQNKYLKCKKKSSHYIFKFTRITKETKLDELGNVYLVIQGRQQIYTSTMQARSTQLSKVCKEYQVVRCMQRVPTGPRYAKSTCWSNVFRMYLVVHGRHWETIGQKWALVL